MYRIFRFEDSYLEDSSNRPMIQREMEDYIKELLTWGIILYNKNSVRPKAFVPFQRSKNPLIQKTLQKKLNLLKVYYLKRDLASLGFNYRLRDMLYFAFFSRSERVRNDYGFLHQKLIELVFDQRRAVKASDCVAVETHVLRDEEEEEIAHQGCERVNQLEKELTAEARKKALYLQMMEDMEDSEQEEDIDSD